MKSYVPKIRRTQQRITNSMNQNVCIRVPNRSVRSILQLNPAKEKASAFLQFVYVETHSDS